MGNATTHHTSSGGLRHVGPETKGIRRRRQGTGFSYIGPKGPVPKAKRAWIESLAIPPAWKDVWVSPYEDAHILAYGTDDRGRKQYIYHPEWRKDQDAAKFARLVAFGRRLPTLRAHLEADLLAEGLSREKVIAAVVRTLDLTFTRVGSATHARENGSRGITTLDTDNVRRASGGAARFLFRGKGGQERDVTVHDPLVAKAVRECQRMQGERLFEYCDDEAHACEREGTMREVTARDVNDYLHEVMGHRFSSKDFRTWAATTIMTHQLHEAERPEEERERRRVVKEAVEEVAERLGNTPAVCRSSYIHPAVPAAYLDGTLWERVGAKGKIEGLWPQEALTLRLLGSFGPSEG